MAESNTVAAMALPSSDDVSRAEAFTREPFVHPGEELAIALAQGTPRRRAFDDALAELDAGLKVPSTTWRRQYSLLLGLERVLSEEEPKLADGTTLSAHQVDALSGTLTALLAEASISMPTNGAVDVLAGAAILGVEDEEPDDSDDEPTLEEPEYEDEDDEDSGLDEDDDDEEDFARAPADEEDDEEAEDVAAELEAELDRAEAET